MFCGRRKNGTKQWGTAVGSQCLLGREGGERPIRWSLEAKVLKKLSLTRRQFQFTDHCFSGFESQKLDLLLTNEYQSSFV